MRGDGETLWAFYAHARWGFSIRAISYGHLYRATEWGQCGVLGSGVAKGLPCGWVRVAWELSRGGARLGNTLFLLIDFTLC